jgi:hypothetical protein
MEQPPNPPADDAQEEDLGEDHREGAPGYDLDEQQAIAELQQERDGGE